MWHGWLITQRYIMKSLTHDILSVTLNERKKQPSCNLTYVLAYRFRLFLFIFNFGMRSHVCIFWLWTLCSVKPILWFPLIWSPNTITTIAVNTAVFFKLCAMDNKMKHNNWYSIIFWYSSFYYLIYTTYNRRFNIKLFSWVNHYIHLIKYKQIFNDKYPFLLPIRCQT